MNTSGNSFELILEEVIKQKRILEEMQAENESLRQQLADLRAGKGIIIDILGQRHMLNSADNASLPDADEVTSLVPVPKRDAAPSHLVEPVSDGSTQKPDEALVPALRDGSDDFLLAEVSDNGSLFSTPLPATASLEEALLEEFANAATRQMNVWSGPITNHPSLDEGEKAALRRELMGSFLLE
jgi:hypothetical protein